MGGGITIEDSHSGSICLRVMMARLQSSREVKSPSWLEIYKMLSMMSLISSTPFFLDVNRVLIVHAILWCTSMCLRCVNASILVSCSCLMSRLKDCLRAILLIVSWLRPSSARSYTVSLSSSLNSISWSSPRFSSISFILARLSY